MHAISATFRPASCSAQLDLTWLGACFRSTARQRLSFICKSRSVILFHDARSIFQPARTWQGIDRSLVKRNQSNASCTALIHSSTRRWFDCFLASSPSELFRTQKQIEVEWKKTILALDVFSQHTNQWLSLFDQLMNSFKVSICWLGWAGPYPIPLYWLWEYDRIWALLALS